MQRKNRTPEKNAKLYMNSVLSPMRHRIIKAYFRKQRTAEKTGLTPEQIDFIFFEVCHTMSHVMFCRFMIQDESFRETMINDYLRGEK